MGRPIPADTGFEWYRGVRIPADEPPPLAPPQPTEDEMDLECDTLEYAFETEEPIGGRAQSRDVE